MPLIPHTQAKRLDIDAGTVTCHLTTHMNGNKVLKHHFTTIV